MIGDVGLMEVLIIGAVVLLLFGAGKIGGLGKDLGTSVREFRRAIRDDDEVPLAAAAASVAPVVSEGAPLGEVSEERPVALGPGTRIF